MIADPKLFAARERARLTHERLMRSIDAAKDSLSPSTIAGNAIDGVKSKAVEIASDGADIARRRPGAVAAGAAAIGLFLARRPIARLIRCRNKDETA